jgi:hypothetical protein
LHTVRSKPTLCMQAPCPSPIFKPSAKDPDRPNACMFTAFQGNSLSVR